MHKECIGYPQHVVYLINPLFSKHIEQDNNSPNNSKSRSLIISIYYSFYKIYSGLYFNNSSNIGIYLSFS